MPVRMSLGHQELHLRLLLSDIRQMLVEHLELLFNRDQLPELAVEHHALVRRKFQVFEPGDSFFVQTSLCSE